MPSPVARRSIEIVTGEDTLKLGVAAHLNWELEIEIEIDGYETELEIEIKWTDDPSDDAEPDAAPATTDPAPTPAAVEPADDPVPAPEKPTPPRRGRPRKVAAT